MRPFGIIFIVMVASAHFFAAELPSEKGETQREQSNPQSKLRQLIQSYQRALEEDDITKALENGEAALALIEAEPSLPSNPDLQLDLINLYQDDFQFEKALKLIRRGEESAKIIKDQKRASLYKNLEGFSLWKLGKFQEALDAFTQALKIQKQNGFQENQSGILHSMGMVYSALNLHDLALQVFFKSLDLAEERHENTGRILNSIGVVFHNMDQTEKALVYYQRVLEIEEKAQNKRGMADVLNNIGVEHQQRGDYNLAENYYKRSLSLEKELKNRLGICDGYNNLGEVKLEMGDLEAAETYFRESMSLAEEFQDTWRVSDSLRNLAKVNRKKNNLKTAAQLIDEALEKAQSAESQDLLTDIYEERVLIFQKMGDFARAFASQSKRLELEKEILRQDAVRSAIELDVKYKTEQNAKEIELLKKDRKIQGMVTWGMGIGIGGVLILFLLLYRNYRIKIKANQEIRLKNLALKEAHDKLDLLSRTDALTSLSNRRDMIEKIQAEKNRLERNKTPFTIILADIDHFKNFNDTYGHDCGDLVLKTLATGLQNSIRKQDTICRWGGEEFLFLLPDTDLEGGRLLAEKLRKKVELVELHYAGTPLRVTMTFGVSEYEGQEIEHCIHVADQSLYLGKDKGRNCVVTQDQVIGSC